MGYQEIQPVWCCDIWDLSVVYARFQPGRCIRQVEEYYVTTLSQGAYMIVYSRSDLLLSWSEWTSNRSCS